MAIKLQIRRGTASQWTSADPTLLAGEIGYETDTGNLKIGTGSAVWTALPYWSSSVPALSSAQTSLNHADYRNAGRFTITAGVTSDTPAAWVPASDAPAVLMVTVSGSNVVQVLVSTKTQKAFQRAYDGSAWTTWVSDTLFADSVGTTEIANNAVTTAKIINDAVTFAKMQNSAAAGLSVVGRSTNSAGDFGEITAANDAEVLRRSGSSIVFATVATNSIANDAVTYAKIQNVSATDRLLGRQTAGSGDVEEITCTAAGRALLDDADATAQRTTLDVVSFTGMRTYGGVGSIVVAQTSDIIAPGTSITQPSVINTAVAKLLRSAGGSTSHLINYTDSAASFGTLVGGAGSVWMCISNTRIATSPIQDLPVFIRVS